MRKLLVVMLKTMVNFLSKIGIGRFYLVKCVYSFLLSHFFSYLKINVAEVHGNKMFLDSKDSLNLSIYGVYERFITEVFYKEVKSKMTVIDVGAHIGYYSLLSAKLVGEKGRVFAFEPDPRNFSLLSKNIEVNGYKNIVLEQKAVSSESGITKLYICEEASIYNRTYDPGDGSKFIEVESISLDDYFKSRNDKIDFIKIDVEGSEYSVIQGMINLLEKNINVIIVTEFAPNLLQKFGIEAKEYLDLLIKYGFRLYNINTSKRELELIDKTKILELYTPEKGNYTNILCKRKK